METEERITHLQTRYGTITVKETVNVFREHLSGLSQIKAKHRAGVELTADGDWLTEDMAAELGQWLSANCRGPAPEWAQVDDGRPTRSDDVDDADSTAAGSDRDEYRARQAIEQLFRYSGVLDKRLLDVLDLLTDINDDMHHARHKSVVTEACTSAATLLISIENDYSP